VAVIVRYLLGARYAPSDYLHFTPALAMMNRSSTGWFAPKLLSHREAIIDRQKADPTDVPATWANVSRAKEELDWEPTVCLEEGICHALKWYQTNRDWAQRI
jgi:nucleoside-diphosphate-sugar epimerase